LLVNLNSMTAWEIRCNVAQNVNRRLMKPHTQCVLELSFRSAMRMELMHVCSAGAPQDTVGVRRRMELSGLGLELEDNPTVKLVKVQSL